VSTSQKYFFNLDTASGHYSSWSYTDIGTNFEIKLLAQYTIMRPSNKWAPSSTFTIKDANDKNGIWLGIASLNGGSYIPYVYDTSKVTENNKKGKIFKFKEIQYNEDFRLKIISKNGNILIQVNEEKFDVNHVFSPDIFTIGNSSGEISVKQMQIEKI